MSNLDTLNRGDLFAECVELAREQGIADKESWETLVEEVISAHLDLGELNLDQDLEGARAELTARWDEYVQLSAEETPAAIDEDPDAPKA